ncbi:tyrosine-type recombinase/integrase [Thalassotalea maritima]|uniref:tyrosine-type recombinase/integrase n=1 Tax=Thalassotalea maritima TaxID=3242416 RepID=UPI00352779FE
MSNSTFDIFAEAAQAGEIDGSVNPATVVKNPNAKITKSRLTLEQFTQIVKHQKYLPHKYSYLLALVTAQRRTDLALLRKQKGTDWEEKYKAYRDNLNHFIKIGEDYGSFASLVEHAPYSFIDGDYLHIFQIKTGKLIKIPMALKLDAQGLSIADIVDKAMHCDESDFVLHHTTARTTNKVGDPLHPDSISRSFKRARVDANIEWQGRPATFHEIRSLAERLYREQGVDTRLLCGHSQQKMTDRYNDLRGSDWKTITIQ